MTEFNGAATTRLAELCNETGNVNPDQANPCEADSDTWSIHSRISMTMATLTGQE